MLIERIEDKGLAHYSYVVACEGAGTAAVVDPRRDVDVYLDFAAEKSLRITHVLETHIHADFASGGRELAERTGAELCVSAYDHGEQFEVRFPHRDLREGDEIAVGNVRLRPLHTPGHTPEHLCYLVFDTRRADDVPMVLLSGDFLFVGSLGRPDLLGEEAKRDLARKLYASVQEKLDALPDGLEVSPAHGAGSMCGAGMSGRPVSTLGFERVANPYLRPDLGEDEFVDMILSTVPPFPPYYRRMKQLNSDGPPRLPDLPGQDAIPVDRFHECVSAGHVVIDLRDQLSFGAAHIPGALGIGGGNSVSTWTSWVVPYDRPLLLVAEGKEQATQAVRSLVRVGLDDVRGWLEGGMDAWIRAGLPTADVPQVGVTTLAEHLNAARDALFLVDVREPSEWASGHIREAQHVPAYDLPDRANELRSLGSPVALICATGYRSTVGASVLKRAGLRQVVSVTGGMTAWKRAGLPTA